MKRKTRLDKGAKVGWTPQEAGRYTHPELGEICKESNGWVWHPGAGSGLNRDFGPYKMLNDAQKDTAAWKKVCDWVG